MHRKRVQNVRDLMASYIGTDKIDMRYYQGPKFKDKRETNLEKFHTCGNTACFAGILAMSPEFQQQGGGSIGIYGMSGAPIFNGSIGPRAVSEYLDIDRTLAKLLVSGELAVGNYCSFYEKQWEDVKAEDVVKKLDMILNGELE